MLLSAVLSYYADNAELRGAFGIPHPEQSAMVRVGSSSLIDVPVVGDSVLRCVL